MFFFCQNVSKSMKLRKKGVKMYRNSLKTVKIIRICQNDKKIIVIIKKGKNSKKKTTLKVFRATKNIYI